MLRVLAVLLVGVIQHDPRVLQQKTHNKEVHENQLQKPINIVISIFKTNIRFSSKVKIGNNRSQFHGSRQKQKTVLYSGGQIDWFGIV